jgi:hypothetical protein
MEKEELYLKAIGILKNGYIKFDNGMIVYLSGISHIKPIFDYNTNELNYYEFHLKNGKFEEVSSESSDLIKLLF